jgi:hypothetical protein
MRLHTALTEGDVRAALRESVGADGVYLDHMTAHSSRSHDHAFEVRLAGVPGRDRNGKARRKTNTGQYGAGTYMAATYDEWGYFMAAIFGRDPFAKFGTAYNGAEDFMRKTEHAYPVSVAA